MVRINYSFINMWESISPLLLWLSSHTMGKKAKMAILKFAVIWFFTQDYGKVIFFQ